jgi:uncharacterized protein
MTSATTAGRPPLVEGLLDPAAYPHPTDPIRLVETHISWVFLTGPFVYKVKKPRDLGFLDYTTLDRRRHFCGEEVRISGRFAPSIYRGAVPITGTPEQPRIGGEGEPIEWAVQLVQFDEADRLDNRFAAGRLSAADCRALGAAIAEVEERLPVADVASGWGTAESIAIAVAVNFTALRERRPDVATRVDALEAWLTERLAAAAATIRRRIAAGRVRECHGDLHLANLVLHDGQMTAFDAIEFSPGLRWIDVANDVAFLAMDLESRGRPDLAAHVVSSWIEAADDHAALAVLPIYKVYRAVVRASVAALRTGDPAASAETDRYLDLAERLTQPVPPALVGTCGPSGSGKSTVAAEVTGSLHAIRIRSDVERKRLAGMAATDRPVTADATAALYDEAVTRRVYDRLADLARTILAAGCRVVIDATCTRRWQRDALAAVARDTGAALVWVDFDVAERELVGRVTARAATGTDASDASAAIVRRQLALREPIGDDELRGRAARLRVAEGAEAVAVAATVRAAVEVLEERPLP